MLTKTKPLGTLPGLTLESAMQPVRPSLAPIVALVSFGAGVGSGWRVLTCQAGLLSPLMATATMTLVTFAGWYVWGFFTHQISVALFGAHSDYRGTLNAFGRAYVFQALILLTFTSPPGWLWGWIAFYATVTAWGIIGPRHLGMRTWQAVAAAALGMLLWLACQLALSLVLTWNSSYMGLGPFSI